MKKVIFLATTGIIFALLNFFIWSNERILAEGETVYLELAPVDPRSLMQGDYMSLRYKVQDEAPRGSAEKQGYLVLEVNAQGIGNYSRLYKGEKLKSTEVLLRYHQRADHIFIKPDSFMFQEGHAEFYENAKYGVFKFQGADRYLLVGLADAELKKIEAS